MFTVEQLAEEWSVSSTTIMRYINSGSLVAVNLGTESRRNIRVRKEDAEAFIKARTIKKVHKAERPRVRDWLGAV